MLPNRMTAASDLDGLATELGAADRQMLWHPYTPMPSASPSLPVAGARGARLELVDGRTLIDGMSSWWCTVHGYRHPHIDAAITGQLERMAHVMFGGLTHEPAIRLAERLLARAPAGLEHVFFADSGSVSVEVAIKMAVQFWQGRGRPARRRFLAFRGGYHGDTLGAMALCDPERGMHRLMRGVVANHLFADRPPGGFAADLDDAWSTRTEALVAAHADELAAIVVEPVVQGAGGMHFYAPAYVEFLRELADRHALLLILDEIATGFGRTGAFFAADHADVAPDIMCVGKALTGGYLTLAATLCTADVAKAITSSPAGALMHGPTFMANPLACAAALASLDVLDEGHWRDDVKRIEAGLTAGLAAAASLPEVVNVRALGAIGVIQLTEPIDVQAATAAAVAHGVWLRPFADLVYTMPPYIATDDEVRAIASAAVIAAIAGARGSRSRQVR